MESKTFQSLDEDKVNLYLYKINIKVTLLLEILLRKKKYEDIYLCLIETMTTLCDSCINS